MTKFIVRRFLWMILVLFVVSFITFMLMNSIPGGPFDNAGDRALPEAVVANIEARYGLDDPIWFRYVNYIGSVAIPKLTYGNWQYNLTLDREEAGLEPMVDEEGEDIKLDWPRNVLAEFEQTSVIDNHLINIPLPFIRREVPVTVRENASAGSPEIGIVGADTEIEILRLNNRGTFYEVRFPDTELSNGAETGWIAADRISATSSEFDPENPGMGEIVGATATLRMMNFGPSYASRSQSVNDLFRNQLVVSAQLGLASIIIAVIIGIPLGTIAGLRRNTTWDYVSMGVAIVGVSVPVIVLGPVMRYVAVQVPWLPVSGWGTWQQMLMPAFALGFSQSALIARLTRASLLQVLNEDYIRTARAKGLDETVVVVRHAMKNAMIPVVTVVGPILAFLVTGSFVTETIFAIPGIGRYFVTSITNRDYPVIMGTILMFAMFIVIANALVDIVYALLDPRIRFD